MIDERFLEKTPLASFSELAWDRCRELEHVLNELVIEVTKKTNDITRLTLRVRELEKLNNIKVREY